MVAFIMIRLLRDLKVLLEDLITIQRGLPTISRPLDALIRQKKSREIEP